MYFRLSSAVLAAVMVAGGASAATLQFSNIEAQWSNPVGGTNVVYQPGSGFNDPATIRWGNAPIDDKSGYTFASISDPVSAALDTAFDLGTFTHINNPINIPNLSQVDLQVRGNLALDADDNGGFETDLGMVTFDFRFFHNETPNDPGDGDCPGGDTQPCGDLVNVNLLTTTDSFFVDGVEYTMSIFGFIPTGETETSTTFFSDENDSNSATLRAEFTAKVDVIPVPAALPLLLAGMGALGFAARRRKG